MDVSAERKIMREKQQSCICNYESTRSFQQMKISSETSSSTSQRLFCVLVREHTREHTLPDLSSRRDGVKIYFPLREVGFVQSEELN